MIWSLKRNNIVKICGGQVIARAKSAENIEEGVFMKPKKALNMIPRVKVCGCTDRRVPRRETLLRVGGDVSCCGIPGGSLLLCRILGSVDWKLSKKDQTSET